MTPEQLYQPISKHFTKEEMEILPNLCLAAAKKADEYSRKANESERAQDEDRVLYYMQQAFNLRVLAHSLRNDCLVEQFKEEWIGEILVAEINSRMNLCKKARYEMYNELSQKIINLIW